MAAGVRIESLAAGGDGVGRLPDGRAVFVPRSAPGDLVAVTSLQDHRSWARAGESRLVEPGPDRVAPRCRHFDADRCGGCQWQHVAPAAQRNARGAIVGEALRRLGRVDTRDPEVEAAPSNWGYRHRLTLHRDAGGRIGLHPLDRPAETFDLVRCEIAHEDLNRLWRALSAARELLPRPLDRLVLRRSRAGALDVVARVAHRQAAWPAAATLHGRLREEGIEAALWLEAGVGVKAEGRRQQRRGERPRAPVFHLEPAAGCDGRDQPPAFEQVAPGMGDRIRSFAVESLGDVRGRHAWDLYAGAGDATELLLAGGATVESVEVTRPARRLGGPAAGWHEGRVEDVVGRLAKPDVVITNPPRTGMDRRAVEGLAAAAPARIAYVSCDPATLARDLRRLEGYRLAALRAFDLFPQTAHVECVAVLGRG